jgi:GH25 family lysozyme M1 (1,4-beta-N-acetylmuramidase)
MALDVLVADVSGYQDEDVSALAGLGFKAVIPKYTEDMSSASGWKAHEQTRSARAAGMSVFAGYDFGLGSNGRDQCDALLQAFGGDNITRAVLDAEVASVTPEIVIDFGRRAREWNPGVKPLLYASTSFMQGFYGDYPEIPQLYDAWIAAYTAGYASITWPASPVPAAPAPFSEVIGWQFTSVFPTPLGNIDASVFNSTVFNGNVIPMQDKHTRSTDMVIYHNVDVHDPDGGTATGEWVAMQGSDGPTQITAGEAFVHAISGVPWVDNMHGLNIVGLGIRGAQARKNAEFWDGALAKQK